MPERDYFDIPDDDPVRPVLPQPALLPHHDLPAEQDELVYPKAGRHVSTNIIAVIVFLVVIGGCGFLVFHQMQQQLHTAKPVVPKVTTQK